MIEKEIIEKYNIWVKEHKIRFSKIKEDCPFYIVTKNTLKRLSKDQKEELRNSKSICVDNERNFKLWKEIFSKIDHELKIKKSYISKNIKFNYNKILKENLLNFNDFVFYCNQNGMYIIKYHLNWLVENKIIIPFRKSGNSLYFNRFQLYELDYIEHCKKESLEYPNPQTIFLNKRFIIKQNPTTWQDYILDNKSIIQENSKKYLKIIKLFTLINGLNNAVNKKSLKTYLKYKKEFPKTKQKEFYIAYQGLKYKAFKSCSLEIKEKLKIEKKEIESWTYNILPVEVIRHNPLWQIAHRSPLIEKLFFKEENKIKNIFKKENDIKLANYYVKRIEDLNFLILL
jgi:hypothetical protein